MKTSITGGSGKDVLEEIRARHDDADKARVIGGVHHRAWESSQGWIAHTDRAALLALISAQPGVSPGGEGVVVPGEVCDRLLEAMLHHGVYDGIAVAVVRPSDLDVMLKAVTRRVDLFDRPTSPDPARATEEREGK